MFCQSCGAQVTGAFCTKCGARVDQAPPLASAVPPAYAPPPPPPQMQYAPPQYSQPLPPAAKTGAGIKILFVVLAILGVMGLLAAGGVWYAWHKVKQVAMSKGVDLNGLTETHHGPTRRVDACALLTKEDLSQILSLNVERSEGTGKSSHSTCRYYSSGAQQRAQNEALAARKKLAEESTGGNTDEAAKAREVGNMIRGITGAVGGTGDDPMLTIEVESGSAKASMTAFKLAMGLTGAAVKSQGGSGGAPNLVSEDVKGVGDEAMFGPLLSLSMFRQGDVSVQIDGRMLPGGREAQIAIAKRIFSRL